jgi:glycosyltransferase involved in cell wall biosynthesis
VAVLGRGVDAGLFSPARRAPGLRESWGASDSHLVALHVGRIAPEKNIPLAVEAYRAMQRARPRMRFIAVGDGPLRARLQAAHPDLLFCGARTGEALAAHYASADVFLFPSETETFGNVTLEAMASGLAVLAYDYAAARVHITSGVTGVLVPWGSPTTFVAAAAALAAAPEALRAIGRRAREHAASLEWREIARQFARLLLGGDEAEAMSTASVAAAAQGGDGDAPALVSPPPGGAGRRPELRTWRNGDLRPGVGGRGRRGDEQWSE